MIIKVFNKEVKNRSQNLKQSLENEIKKNKALRKQNYELNDVLNAEKGKIY